LDWIGVFFFVLFSLARFELNLGLLDRPLVIGMLWSAVTGQWEIALPVAIFFELFFLDLFPIGTYIPPHGPFALLATLALVGIFEVSQPPLAFLLIVLCLPAAIIGGMMEQTHRQWQNLGYTQMLQSTRSRQQGQVSAPKLVGKSLIQLCIMNLTAFLVVMALLVPLTEWLLSHVRSRVLVLPITWSSIWLLGTVGVVLSLRARRVYAILLVVTALAGGYYWIVSG
jgi:mannose/fructose/N-acetylgalactosamine-specific phosphotransferase system component IIC